MTWSDGSTGLSFGCRPFGAVTVRGAGLAFPLTAFFFAALRAGAVFLLPLAIFEAFFVLAVLVLLVVLAAARFTVARVLRTLPRAAVRPRRAAAPAARPFARPFARFLAIALTPCP